MLPALESTDSTPERVDIRQIIRMQAELSYYTAEMRRTSDLLDRIKSKFGLTDALLEQYKTLKHGHESGSSDTSPTPSRTAKHFQNAKTNHLASRRRPRVLLPPYISLPSTPKYNLVKSATKLKRKEPKKTSAIFVDTYLCDQNSYEHFIASKLTCNAGIQVPDESDDDQLKQQQFK